MKVLLAQVDVADGSVATNIRTLQATLAAHPEADLAVFPEMFLPGYDTSSLRTRSLELDSPELQTVADVAGAWGASFTRIGGPILAAALITVCAAAYALTAP